MMIRKSIVMFAVVASTAPASGEVFFSEYLEGAGNNKALEIYSSQGVNLSGWSIQKFTNGSSTPSETIDLSSFSIAAGDVLVIANPSYDTNAFTADTTSSVINYNGDDALVLVNGSTVVDSFGQVGQDPGSSWLGSGGSISTRNQVLYRNPLVTSGDSNPGNAFDPSDEWLTYAGDTTSAGDEVFTGLGSHTVVPEPASLVMLGAGALMLVRRRRGVC